MGGYKENRRFFDTGGIVIPPCRRRIENMRGGKPDYQVRIAQERMQILMGEAKKRARKEPELARRYIMLVRKIGMRYNLVIPRELKNRYCRYCYNYLIPGHNSSYRKKKEGMSIRCLRCNKIVKRLL